VSTICRSPGWLGSTPEPVSTAIIQANLSALLERMRKKSFEATVAGAERKLE